ncbi:hypothetical protein BC828DRAFT_390573 [Blastocladiella britannica]|nr:hypothetical protein BC828DRAFT_390573 [Blastocladiella britannica]
MTAIRDYLDGFVQVVTHDGTVFVGKLRAYDQTTNIVLQQCEEWVIDPETRVISFLPKGTYMIRGDSIVLIGPVDDLADLRERIGKLDNVVPIGSLRS